MQKGWILLAFSFSLQRKKGASRKRKERRVKAKPGQPVKSYCASKRENGDQHKSIHEGLNEEKWKKKRAREKEKREKRSKEKSESERGPRKDADANSVSGPFPALAVTHTYTYTYRHRSHFNLLESSSQRQADATNNFE